MDDALRGGGATAQAVEIVERAAVNVDAGGRERGRRLIGAGQAENVMPGREEFADDRRSNEAGAASDKDAQI
jgi:hypothetical protein